MSKILDLKNINRHEKQSEQAHPQVHSPQTIYWSGPLTYHDSTIKPATIIASILIILGVVVEIFERNLLNMLVFLLLALVVLLHSRKRPVYGEFEVGPAGIRVNNELFHYQDLRSFWIDYQPEVGIKEMSLQLKKWYSTYVKIPLLDQDPVQMRSFLLKFIPEIKHHDTLADALARRL